MTTGGDVRGFYAALGIELPGWAGANVTVRCFADPDAHAHEDRSPSCSISTEHGAWRCWGCGAHGGAYDAALALGHAPASAIELLVDHGLTGRQARGRHGDGRHEPPRPVAVARPAAKRRALQATDAEVRRWHETLFSAQCQGWREAIAAQRLWSEQTMRELELGHDGSRLTVPLRNAHGGLRGVLRYLPGAEPKMLALAGTRLGLIPHPACEPAGRILLVEGVADMLAARSRGWPAIAVPGDRAWQTRWAQLFGSRNVTIAMDCDRAGRDAARRIARDLRGVCGYRIADLDPGRSDGFDLTDWLRQRGTVDRQRRTPCTPCSSSKLTITR